ncbi:alpha/beta hydrolase [Streptomyces sp. H10-C2]|uniref:alpha/beta fold hydrolase n=1 Tax=unclassified Streptomyces TaxID=2593676 RepID=UPI0024BA5C07|nr:MULTISPECIES: alpha/beta hydrolase [unclassified Streptomyces]MDJ0343539.1 alpha/beta hydrolase [Streptomyces sp. PH10-H1]MDJ0368885.1 alpha/beta hydrolase [Streptomyces sp. H10-C2]
MERFTAVAALGVPYALRTPVPLTELLRRYYPGKFNVVLYFQQPRVPEAELEADVARTLRLTMYALSGEAPPDLVPRWLTGTPDLPRLGTGRVTQPALYISGDLDSAYRFGSLDPMKEAVTGLRDIIILPGCGHWTQQERPTEVNERLIPFLAYALEA